MIFVVLIPAWIWVTLLAASWAKLVYEAHLRLGSRHRVMQGLLVVLALEVAAASSTAIATSQYAIGKYACLMGYFGMWASLVFSLIEAVVLVFLYEVWPKDANTRTNGFSRWVSIWC